MKNSEALKKVETAIEAIGAFVCDTLSVQYHGEIKENEVPVLPAGKYTIVNIRIAVPDEN